VTKVARLTFFRPNFRNLALFEVGWPKMLFGLLVFFSLQLKLVRLEKFVWPFGFFGIFTLKKFL